MGRVIALRPGGFWVVAAAAVTLGHVLAVILAPVDQRDFDVFYLGARSLLETGSPYVLQASDVGLDPDVKPYAYPPLLAALVAPLAWLPLKLAAGVWLGLNVVATVGLGAALASLTGCVSPRRATLWTGLLCVSIHQMKGTHIGQVHNWIALLVVGGWRAGRAGAPLLGLAAAIKLFPGLLGLDFALRRAWGRLGTLCIAAGVPFVLLAPQSIAWVRDVLLGPSLPLDLESQHVMSVIPVGARLFTETRFSNPIVVAPWAAAATSAALLAAVWGALATVVRLTRSSGLRFGALLLCAMLSFPGLGSYHWNLALVALILILSAPAGEDTGGEDGTGGGESSHAARDVFWHLHGGPALRWCGLGFALLAIPVDYGLAAAHPGSVLGELRVRLHSGPGTLIMSPQLIGLGCLLVAAVAAARERSRT